MAAKQKVAILGGGAGSITAAYELTNTPELRARYEVTVYQLGWRLGGKCASGRNQDVAQRIEEHGLHVWFGFYENAFRLMREAYGELGRPPEAQLATWRDAFKPCDDIILYERYAGRWLGRSFKVPRNPLTPGSEPTLPHFWEIAHAMLDHLLARWGALKATNAAVGAALAPGPARLPFGVGRLAEDLILRLLRLGAGDAEHAIAGALALTGRRTAGGPGGPEEAADRSFLWRALDAFKRWLWRYVVKPNLNDDEVRLFFTVFDTGASMLQGVIEDRLIERGFDSVNGEDLREWLRRHGAEAITLSEGPFVRGLYDMAFAYEGGDVTRPAMAAGAAVQDALRVFFTYRGAFTWKMQAGMGDTVFVPLYEVLQRRGVRFKFFHWVSRLGLSADRRSIEEVEVIPQVRLKRSGYKPLVTVEDLDCWPSEPRWSQIVNAKELRDRNVNLEWDANPLGRAPLKLRRGKDFDIVVLGISVGALEPICGELIEDTGNPRFRAMIENSRTVMTQAFQLWLHRPVERLGWPFAANSIMTSFVEPLDTYANMTHLLAREAWPPATHVESIAYFCGVLSDRRGETQERADERVRRQAIAYLQHDAETIWPHSAARQGFDWRMLVDEGRGRGRDRFGAQFWRANLQPTERYVITPPGSVEHRLRAEESGYDNLILAGDWTKNGLDAGCVEAAVMSGMQASRAISGSPEVIVGEDETWLTGPGSGLLPPAGPAPSQARLPAYVEYGGLATSPSPVDCKDATLYSFFLDADLGRMLKLCQRVFNRPSGGVVDVFPLCPYVMLTFGIVEKIVPQLAPWSKMGFAIERQAALWVPACLRSSAAGVKIGWFSPYMWVDNPLSLAGGREIYGYNKNWGSIALPSGGGPATLTLDAFGGDFDASKPAGFCRLIEVTSTTAGAMTAGDARWENLSELVADVRRALTVQGAPAAADPGLALPDSVFEEIISRGGPPQFYLRQFRSLADGLRASSQQITDAGVTVNRIVGRPLTSGFEFSLQQLDSHPVAAELGLKDQRTRAAFEIEMDFVLEDGEVLWEAAS